jgi:hypothetical protein
MEAKMELFFALVGLWLVGGLIVGLLTSLCLVAFWAISRWINRMFESEV